MLTGQQLIALEAVINTIIPRDNDPGGWDSGVGNYLFRQLEGDLANVVGLYQQGLLALDAEAEVINGKSFAALSTESQEVLLAKIERGQVQTVWPIDPASFFVMVVEHSAEGFYSDPGNGGNRDNIAWKMIGFEVTG
jgi:hypothetical protein